MIKMFFNSNEPVVTYEETIRRLHHEYGKELKSKINTLTKENSELTKKVKEMDIELKDQRKFLNGFYTIFNEFSRKQTTASINQETDNLYTIVAKLKNGSTITYSTDDFTLIEHIRKWWKHYRSNTKVSISQTSNHIYSYDFYHFYLDVFTLSRSEILSLDIKVT